jgi:hypothetical protein
MSRHVDGEPEDLIGRVETAARAATAAGEPVRYVRSIFIPDDESCLIVLEASSSEAIDRVVANAGQSAIRIAPAWTAEASTVGSAAAGHDCSWQASIGIDPGG